jgi:thiol-disulfide isomerase/thioredoxin
MSKHRALFRSLKLIAIVNVCFVLLDVSALAQESYESIYDEASQYYRRGNYEEALRLFNRANSLKNGTSQECLMRIAQTFGKLGAYKNVLQICDTLFLQSGGNLFYRSKALDMIGTTLIASATVNPERPDPEQLLQAIGAFRQLLKISSRQYMAHYNLGVVFAWLNRPVEAVAEFQSYLNNADNDEVAAKARKFIANPRLATADLAPYFSFLSADGEYKTSDDLRGKVLLIDFWSGRNSLCIEAIPHLSKLVNKFKSDPFVLISVNSVDSDSKWREYIAKYRMNWTQTSDSNSKMQQAFQIKNIPTYILIDHEGVLRYRLMGFSPQIEDQVKYALKWAADSKLNPLPQVPVFQPPTEVQMTSIPKSKPDDSQAYAFRIPKPVLQINNVNVSSATGSRISGTPYSLRITNWASMPDELFLPEKSLPSCSPTSMTMVSSASGVLNQSRMELLIMSESGERLRSVCGMPRAELLQSFSFVMPNYPQAKRIYVQLKDRITGNYAESDMIAVP